MGDSTKQWVDEFEAYGPHQCGVGPTEHRPKLEASIFPGAGVCRRVDRTDIKANQAAEKAINQGWGRLRSRKAWDETDLQGWEDVAKEARETKEEVQFGIVCGLLRRKAPIFLRVTPAASLKAQSLSRETT